MRGPHEVVVEDQAGELGLRYPPSPVVTIRAITTTPGHSHDGTGATRSGAKGALTRVEAAGPQKLLVVGVGEPVDGGVHGKPLDGVDLVVG